MLMYNLLITAGLIFLSPLVLASIMSIGKRRKTFLQRMGWYHRSKLESERHHAIPRLWVHALSVGEVLSAYPLTMRLKRLNPNAEVIFTASTLAGYQTACQLFAEHSIRLTYFPYDWIWAVRKAADLIDPTHIILTETDIWPNFLWEMQRRRVPVFLVNLRISDRTWRNYERFKRIVNKVYAAFDHICVQTRHEKQRLVQLGLASQRISITGNLKFDVPHYPTSLKQTSSWHRRLKISADHKVVVAGSTHEGEEAILCDVLKPYLSASDPPLRNLIIAPRDTRRSLSIRSQCRQLGLPCQTYSQLQKVEGGACPPVVVIDSIGILKEIYALAYIAFVGGSLVPAGGHNPLEPAFWGKPVIFGYDMRDFALIADYLLDAGGAMRVEDAAQLALAVRHLIENPKRAADMGKKALDVLRAHQGAVDRTLSCLNIR